MADATKRLATDSTLSSKLTAIDNDLKDSTNGLGGINTKLTTIDTDLKNSSTGLGGINTKLTTIDTDLKDSTNGLGGINTKLTTIDTDLKDSTNGLGGINTKLTTIDTDLKNPSTGLGGINTKLTSIDNDLKTNGPVDSALKAIGTAINNLPNATQEAADNANVAAAEAISAADRIEDMRFTNCSVFPYTDMPNTKAGVTVTHKGGGVFTINGTASEDTFMNIIDTRTNGLPDYFIPGQDLFVDYTTSSELNCKVELWSDPTQTGGSNWKRFSVLSINNSINRVALPSNSKGLIARIAINSGVTYDDTFILRVMNAMPDYVYLNGDILMAHEEGLEITDLNEVLTTGFWLLPDRYDYANTPKNAKNLVFLQSIVAGNWRLQILYPWTADSPYFWIRRGSSDGGTWTEWARISNNGGNENELLVTDLNSTNVKEGWWILTDAHTYTNVPDGFELGFLCNVVTGNWRLQTLYQFAGGKVYKRRGNPNGTAWEDWTNISGVENIYNTNNSYNFPHYDQEVNLNVEPIINTDTNNYLPSTNDDTDRTADILAMLSSTGVCRLGPGDFYVENLQMPDGSTIVGSGYATKVHMIGVSDGFAIRIGSHCHLESLHVIGGDSAPTFADNPGGRHGILWQGDYTEHETAPILSFVDNVRISNFSGGGITCYDTGYGTSSGLSATNIHVHDCWAGINISYFSEFNHFTNVRCGSCRVGCVNNGGNNIFVNCDFSSNTEIGMLMDNSQGQSRNNSHGSCVACVFNHTYSGGQSNSGIGIQILNCHSGFIFDGCQIFYSRIDLENSDGVVFSGCNFGNNNCNVDIVNGGTIVFANNMTEGAIPITVTNNTNVHFVNCYNKFDGSAWKP